MSPGLKLARKGGAWFRVAVRALAALVLVMPYYRPASPLPKAVLCYNICNKQTLESPLLQDDNECMEETAAARNTYTVRVGDDAPFLLTTHEYGQALDFARGLSTQGLGQAQIRKNGAMETILRGGQVEWRRGC